MREAGRLLGIAPHTVLHRALHREFEVLRAGGRTFIRRADIVRAVAAATSAGSDQP